MHPTLRAAGLTAALGFAFALGISVDRGLTAASAESVPLKPTIVNLLDMAAADFPSPPPNGTNASKALAVADGATVSVQRGMVPKHYHADANEIQYIVEGTGKFWLGDSYRDVKPGDLIVIPKGTAHAGTTTTFKAIAIKTPPQDPSDIHPVP